MSEVSRRSFLGLLGGAAALPLTGSVVAVSDIPIGEEIFELVYQENDMFQHYSGYSTLITETLRKNKHKVAENISQNNVLLARLRNK